MSAIIHEEKTESVIIKPLSNGLYNIKTDNENWSTIDHLILEDELVDITEHAIAYDITLSFASSMSDGLIAVLQFNNTPNLNIYTD